MPLGTDEEIDPSGLGLPPVDPNATPPDLGQMAANALGAILPHSGSEYSYERSRGGGAPAPAPVAPAAPAPPGDDTPFVGPPGPDPGVTVLPPETVTMKKLPAGGGGGGGLPSTTKLLKDEQSANAKLQGAEQAQVSAVDAKAKVEHEQAAAASALDAQQAEQNKALEDERKGTIEKGTAEIARIADATSKMRVRDMFEGRDGAAVGAALAVGLGAFSSAFTGGPNYAMQIIDGAQARYRQRQLDAIEQSKLGLQEKKELLNNARIELAAREAGQLKKFAMERDAVVRKFGASAADAANDGLKRQLEVASSQRAAEAAKGLVSQVDALQTSRVSRRLMGSEITKNNAAALKDATESGRGVTKQMEKAGIAQQMQDDFAVMDKEGELSEKAKQRIQKNDALIESQKHSWLAAQARGVVPTSMVPISRYDGLSERETRIANAGRLAAEKSAALNYVAGGEKSMEMLVNEFDPSLPGGPSRQKIENMRNIMNANAALGGKQTQIARAGVAAGRAATGPVAETPRDQMIRDAREFIATHPRDPRTPAAMKRLKEMGAF